MAGEIIEQDIRGTNFEASNSASVNNPGLESSTPPAFSDHPEFDGAASTPRISVANVQSNEFDSVGKSPISNVSPRMTHVKS